jgi:glycosyltransferase involved in cell wall biosynthesis
MKRQTLGVVMIVKNEEKNLGGILSDIRDVVDEICIVDTGSSDGTISVAESFGAKIGHFPWVDDFSAARNHSIALASSDYLLWLDADDRVDESDRKALATLKRNLRRQKDRAYMLKILSTSESMPNMVSYQARIIPNRRGVRFTGRVHEQILPALEQNAVIVKPVNIVIRHTGYHDLDARPAKARRNMDILMEELRDGKDTANQCFFIAMTCMVLDEYEQCLGYLAKARQKRTDEDWYHISFTISTECLLRLHRSEDARKEIAQGIAIFRESPLLHYYLGLVCMQAEQFTEAAEALGKAATLPTRIDAYPSPPDLATTILLQFGKALEKLGRVSDAINTYTRALKSGTQQKTLHHALGMALASIGDIDTAITNLKEAKNLATTTDMSLFLSLARLLRYKRMYTEAHQLYLEALAYEPHAIKALTGLVFTSVATNDIEHVTLSLETLMYQSGMDPNRVVQDIEDLAYLCVDVGKAILNRGNPSDAATLAEAAWMLDNNCWIAQLLSADIAYLENNIQSTISSLEMALRAGAPYLEVEQRMTLIQNL